MNFGERLKASREKAGLLQKDAAASVNVTSSQLSRYEKNKSDPSPQVLKALAALYGVSTDYLLGLEARYRKPNGTSVVNENIAQYWDNFNELTEEHKKLVHQITVALLDTSRKEK